MKQQAAIRTSAPGLIGRARTVTSADGERVAAMIAALLVLVGIYSYFCVRLYGNYLLIRDDPANIAATAEEGPRGWLTRGMADYYHVYPEWEQSGFSDFYRPVWNLIIYIERAALGQHYWAWFLFYCVIQSLGALLFLNVLWRLRIPSRPANLFSLLFLFNPAFVNFGFIYPGFQFDVFASLMLLAALFLLLEDRYAPALALIATAVFTKESAAFAPVSAAITVFILKRDMRWSAAMLAPLFAWMAARWLAFHTMFGGTFESPSSTYDLLVNIAKGIMIWPSGALPADFPERMVGASGIPLLALLLANAILWLVLFYAAWEVVRSLRHAPQKRESKLQAVLFVWALGALSFCILTRPQPRLGASVYVFLLLFFAYFLFTNALPRYIRWTPILILSLVTLVSDGNFMRHAVAHVRPEMNGQHALYTSLRSLPQDGRSVFVVNAPTTLSPPRSLAKVWNLRLDITFINQFRGCQRSENNDAHYSLSSTKLSVEIPSCASYVFAGVGDDFLSKGLVGGLPRSGIGTYRFPDSDRKRQSNATTEFGRKLEIQFAVYRLPTVLAYDWRTSAYRVLLPTRSLSGGGNMKEN